MFFLAQSLARNENSCKRLLLNKIANPSIFALFSSFEALAEF